MRDRAAGKVVHQTHHRAHVHLDVLDVCKVNYSLLTFLDINLRLPLRVQLQALQDVHKTFGLRHALRLAHEPITTDSQSLQFSLIARNELVHAKQFDQPLIQITLVHTDDRLGIDRLQQVHELVRALLAVIGN